MLKFRMTNSMRARKAAEAQRKQLEEKVRAGKKFNSTLKTSCYRGSFVCPRLFNKCQRTVILIFLETKRNQNVDSS